MGTHLLLKDKRVVFMLSLVLFFGFLFSCGSQKDLNDSDIDNMEELKEAVDSRKFEIEHDWANPMSGGAVNLIGNTNFIRFKGDSVELFLPYYGVRHSGGNYGGDGGIEYEGLAEELRIEENQERGNITIEFEAEEESEDYRFNIILFGNGTATTSVNSSERNSISYRGSVETLQEKIDH